MNTRDFLKCRSDFPSLNRTHNGVPLAYFDGPAGTQVPQQVIDAIAHYYGTCNANAGGNFITSRESDELIDRVRQQVALYLNAEGPETISFGANMTSLTFSLAHAIGRRLQPGDEVVITQLDHEANRGPWLNLREQGATVQEVLLRSDGTLDYDSFRPIVNERTRLVAVGWASNALGTVNDIGLVRELTRRVGAWLLVDAVHYAPHFPIDVQALGADFLLCSAYKFYGPHVGILYTHPNLLERLQTDRLRTQKPQGPSRIETGTLNHAAIIGVKTTVEYIATFGQGETFRGRIESAMGRIGKYEQRLASLFYEKVHTIPGIKVYGPSFDVRQRAPTVSFTVEGSRPSEVARRLSEDGILVWDGHFYAIRPVEILDLAGKGGLVRVGMSLYNTKAEVERLLDALARISADY